MKNFYETSQEYLRAQMMQQAFVPTYGIGVDPYGTPPKKEKQPNKTLLLL